MQGGTSERYTAERRGIGVKSLLLLLVPQENGSVLTNGAETGFDSDRTRGLSFPLLSWSASQRGLGCAKRRSLVFSSFQSWRSQRWVRATSALCLMVAACHPPGLTSPLTGNSTLQVDTGPTGVSILFPMEERSSTEAWASESATSAKRTGIERLNAATLPFCETGIREVTTRSHSFHATSPG